MISNLILAGTISSAAFYGGLQAADLSSTAHFLAEGRCEQNSLFANACGEFKWTKAIAIKTGSAALCTIADHKLTKLDRERRTKWRWLFRAAIFSFYSYHIVDNYRGEP